MYLTLYFSPMKTPLRLLATLSLLASSFLFAQSASAIGVLYSFGTNNNNGDVACSTSGYFTITNNVVTSHTDCAGAAVIPANVTAIADWTFSGANSLTSVNLGNGITSIGQGAFGSTSLSSLTIPNSVTSIGEFVFGFLGGSLNANTYQYCGSALTSGDLGAAGLSSKINSCARSIGTLYNSNTRSGDVACTTGYYTIVNNVLTNYQNCAGAVNVPSGVTAIGAGAFKWATGVTSVVIPNTVTTIGVGAFEWAYQMTSLNLGNSVRSISNSAFYKAEGLRSVTIPNSVTSIGDNAFSMIGLTSLTIGNSVATIGSSAFGSNNLTELNIPDSVTTIGAAAFNGMPNLTSLTLGANVKTIGDYAFAQDRGITSLIIPNSVTTIGIEAFAGLSGLTSLTIGTGLVTISSGAFIQIGVTTLNIPDNVTTIGEAAFVDLSAMTSLTLGRNVTTIGARAFERARNLTSLVIPRSVTNLGINAFNEVNSFSTYEYCGRSLSPANLINAGLLESQTNTCTPSITTPNAPTSIVATSTGPTSASVAFTAPTDNGGSPITGYTVVSNPGRRTASVSQAGSGTISITGLTPGTAYTFRVFAKNAEGDSNLSSPSNAVPEVSISSSSNSNIATITTGTIADSKVATFSSGVTEAVIPSSNALPAVKLSFTGSAPTSVTVVPTANPATPSRTPFMTTSSPKIVDIQITTGAFNGPVTVCLDGAATDSMFHFTGGAWVELPERSYDNGQVCGVTNSFSPFVAAPAAPIASLSTGFAATFSTVSSYDSRITVQITNFDPEFTYTVTSSVGSASISPKGLITVTNIGIDRSTVVTVTTSRAGYESATSGTTGRSQVAPMIPTNKPSVTITDTLITCTIGSYSATPTSSAFSLFVDGKHISTIFSALGEYLPDWIIPWATSSSITRTALLTSATWAMSDAYKGKAITCITLAYSKHAIGLTSSEKMMVQ
jgi:hypothetical protein